MAEEKVFIPHLTECWAPAVKTSGGDTYNLIDPIDSSTTKDLHTVKIDNDAWKKLKALPMLSALPAFADAKDVLSPIVDPLEGKDNIAELQFVSEASVIHAIRARYRKRIIYTDVGRIIIALNPFEARPDIYNEATITRYASAAEPYRLTPHIYQVAAGAFKGVAEDSTNQSILITGESGAGKTESTKLLLRFFAFLGGHQSREGTGGKASIEDRIVMANPILEAFGNASTARNPNSSRFGKWIEMLFNPAMRIRGAFITSYMLEMPRVCEHLHTDRTYHVFYQVLANKLGGTDGKKFKYMTPAPAPEGVTSKGQGHKVNDAEMYSEIVQAFKDYEFTSNEQTCIFNLVACVLFLGNIDFNSANIKGGEGSAIKESCADDVKQAATLLGVDQDILRSCLVRKKIISGKETMEVPLKPSDACSARDGLAKLIYGSLFNWLLSRINEGLTSEAKSYKSIGVLDIAGFERFDTNSYEQLLINLSNEKLQQKFNNDMILAELEDYKKEGVTNIALSFVDNTSVLQLIEGKGGLMDVLDEEQFVPKGTDEGFTSKVIKNHGKAKNLILPKFSGTPTFGVQHFAGDVTYTTSGWLDKNRLAPPREAMDVLQSAHNNVVKQMLKLVVVDTKKTTVGGSFKRQLQDLMSKIHSTQTNYVRCIKPNASHTPGNIESHEILRQLKCSGIMEAIKIRKSGFSLRITFEEFVERYMIVVGVGKPKDRNTAEEIIRLAKSKGVQFEDKDVFLATSKVMARENVRVILDNLRYEAVEDLKRPLVKFVDAYGKATATQAGMLLWPVPLLGDEADTPSGLENQLGILVAGLEEVKKKLGSLENPPSWVGAALLVRDTMQKEVHIVIKTNAVLGKVAALCCDGGIVAELKAVRAEAAAEGIKNGALEKVNKILALLAEEDDWIGQLRGKDTDIASLISEIESKQRDLLNPNCHKALAAAKARLEAEKKYEAEKATAKVKALKEEKAAAIAAFAAAAIQKADLEVKKNMTMTKEVADPAFMRSDSKVAVDEILFQIKPKMPPPVIGGDKAKGNIAKTIAKRQTTPKARRLKCK